MATFRVYKESGNFVTVHKDFIHDSNISWKAKGILLYLLSRPDDWQIYETELEQHSTDGLSGLKSGIKELEEIGYIQRNRKRDKSGRLNGYEYLVYEQPHHIRFSNVGKTVNGKTNNGKTVNGKSHTTNNNSTNNDLTNNNSTNNDVNILSGNPTAYPYRDVIDYLNKQTGKQYKSTTKKNQTVIRARTDEGFTLDDFKKVIDNKVSEWKGTDMEKYLRPETLFGTKFEGYLNQGLQPSGMDQLERMKYDESYWD
ncbi:conserved phage C-terminal domain-containing protein [Staphylococcus pseudintermedius]|uniref:conserved phage C-terminal domain-containing protein n=1 Tax=Staphylococcus pseudintermedius TaxID=283734 RepID=UPI000BBC6590|nr:conserved phage C-terminal domain-containing protein [Staphylococcus pseudintermedius]EGQ3375399.1 replication protein [Staphylococcus pseudintermedius]MCE5604763.1 phage protein [Staphylococcus pseudintermedius]MCE5609477.1 phage protein [Staphylococcus pseudintermedius]MCE5614376.1 phage protein [Staphylococcus pseudintermedius]MCE5708755.1 phage protein [Staphylococcus pseudintermedius]